MVGSRGSTVSLTCSPRWTGIVTPSWSSPATRVVRARSHRRDVRVHADDTGVVTIGRGLVDRQELSVEVFPGAEGHGHGRRLITQGLGLVEAGDLVWAQVAPGNSASLRAFLSCGFVPIGAETLLRPATTDSKCDES